MLIFYDIVTFFFLSQHKYFQARVSDASETFKLKQILPSQRAGPLMLRSTAAHCAVGCVDHLKSSANLLMSSPGWKWDCSLSDCGCSWRTPDTPNSSSAGCFSVVFINQRRRTADWSLPELISQEWALRIHLWFFRSSPRTPSPRSRPHGLRDWPRSSGRIPVCSRVSAENKIFTAKLSL